MSQQADTKDSEDTKAVSIAGGSLFIIGLMLWFFTSGIKSEVKVLRNEIGEVRATLESHGKVLEELSPRIEERQTSDKDSDLK